MRMEPPQMTCQRFTRVKEDVGYYTLGYLTESKLGKCQKTPIVLRDESRARE